MPARKANNRGNQRLRTRKDLLRSAARLMQERRKLTMDTVADGAMVSRATAYRYFPNVEALLVEAPLDSAVPDPRELFAGDDSADPVQRVDHAEAALHRITYQNEAPLRMMLVQSMRQWLEMPKHEVPVRQNRRIPLIEAALAPARHRLETSSYERLCASLALVFGTESMIVFRDVLPLDEATARDVKSWAIEALVRAALEESERS